MRFAAFAGVSTALALSVVLRAFHERPNFYSASVYLAQSNACRLILLNVLLLFIGTFMVSLQRLLYGPLRPIEVEQLWDKAWYAITETALAMTIFRDEVGGWFFLMFVSLLAGKVWGWIGEGRVEILEQQPPSNPRLFHTRLIASLLVSEAFDIFMLRYCVNTLLEQPRPGMMVMFAFEFAVLAITSSSTTARYALSLRESLVIKQQTRVKLEERREEIRAARQEAERQASTEGASSVEPPNIPREEDIDENDIDVPGWSEKGRWVLFLDLATDFLKLVVYMLFFAILFIFHGIPIQIFREVLLTARSFLKRIFDFLKYRNATRDMNTRYPDATPEELERDGTCIICREEMRPWQQPAPVQEPAQGARVPPRAPMDERQRPKKLPCGHILHFGCLRSWLERQQVCPTCRSSVLAPPANRNPTSNVPRPGPDQQPQGQHQHQDNAQGAPHQPGAQQQGRRQNEVRARVWNLGPWRITFAAGGQQQVRNALQRLRDQNDRRTNNVLEDLRQGSTFDTSNAIQDQIVNLERQIMVETNALNLAQAQLGTIRALQGELARLRALQAGVGQVPPGPGPVPAGGSPFHTWPTAGTQQQYIPNPQGPLLGPDMAQVYQNGMPPQTQQYVFTSDTEQVSMGSNHPNLPQGMILPSGWSLLPLQRSGPDVAAPSTIHQDSENNSNGGTAPVVPEAIITEINGASNDSDDNQRHAQEPNRSSLLAPSVPSASTIPNWSNTDGSSGTDSSEPRSSASVTNLSNSGGGSSSVGGIHAKVEEEQEEAVGPSENGHATAAKWKGKGTTVEDDDEDQG